MAIVKNNFILKIKEGNYAIFKIGDIVDETVAEEYNNQFLKADYANRYRETGYHLDTGSKPKGLEAPVESKKVKK